MLELEAHASSRFQTSLRWIGDYAVVISVCINSVPRVHETIVDRHNGLPMVDVRVTIDLKKQHCLHQTERSVSCIMNKMPFAEEERGVLSVVANVCGPALTCAVFAAGAIFCRCPLIVLVGA